MLRVGLTGGIGSGKSTVCTLFADLGVVIIDADVIARQLVEPGQPALAELVACFGNSILNADGSLNRAGLRAIAFADPVQKNHLDSIMHPLIYAEIEAAAAQTHADYCILAIPLLLETQKTQIVDRVLVVDCPEDIQRQRVMKRDKLSESQVAAILASQTCRQQRLARADDIIDNSMQAELLAEQVKSLHNSYLLLATARTQSA